MFRLNYTKFLASIFLVMFTFSSADDIDLISAEQVAYDANILLIMDVSGSMAWGLTNNTAPANPTDSRLSTLQTALSALLSDPEMVNINFGLSSFAGDTTVDSYSQTAHGISYPVSPIDADAETILDQNPLFDHPSTSFLPPTTPGQKTRDYLQTISNTWVPYGGTPIVDSLFEASLYFRGLPTNWGRHDPSKIRAAHPSTYVGLLEDTTVSTTSFQCNSVPCTGTSCNATKTCSTVSNTETCSTPTCGDVCTGPSTTTETCPDGVTSCGNGTNCSSQIESVTRDCITNSEFLCLLVHPTWYDCNTVTETSCTTTCPDGIVDEFGVCQNPVTECSDSEHKQCKEDIDQYSCDADVYQCTSDVESCQHDVCNNQTTNTTVLSGSAVFVSPIKEECPANGIILLSDGAPTVNLSADLASDMIGAGYNNNCAADTSDKGRCGEELATYLANEDNNTSVAGDQFVNTFTVGLSLQNNPTAEAYLKSLAKAGNGEFINASNPTDLVDAFKLAIEGIVDTRARSFSAPTYSINTSNQLSHDNIVYIPMFDRKGVVWPGNLKKYQIENGVLKDADGNAATDSDGALLKTARDLWSAVASEDAVKSGGAANKIVPSSRNALTDDGSDLVNLDDSLANTLFGVTGTTASDNSYKQELVKYIRGTNPADDSVRHHMGDIIHSKPIKMSMASGRSIIFVGTNEGYLHGINDNDGTEAFAYMPQELLLNIKNQYHKHIGSGHTYGVDGPITLWLDESYQKDTSHSDADISKVDNGILDANEKAYLFFGLRRGGKHYFALEVTDPDNPKLIWKKSFGTGDSWSQPVVKQLVWKPNSVTKPVLIFGGGYNEDTAGNELAGGNAVYIVNALTGDQVWTTPTSTALAPDGAITRAVPSKIRVLDMDRNGSIDRLYFGDTGGDIWRVDLNAGDFSGVVADAGDISKAKLHKFASLGGAAANDRKFFEEPDVAVFRQNGKYVATVSIGSGDRTKPLSAVVDDKFFVLYDKEPLTQPPTASTIVIADLKTPTITTTDLASTNFSGWYMDLTSSTGEKVLSTAVTFKNKVMFTTFGTTSVTLDACQPSNTNVARLYIMDLLTGNEDINVQASTGEILGTPQIIFSELQSQTGGACVEGDCVRNVDVRVGKVGPFALPAQGAAVPAGTTDELPRVYWIDNE